MANSLDASPQSSERASNFAREPRCRRNITISATPTDWHWLKTHPAWGWLVLVPWLKEPNAPGIVAKA